MEKENKVSKAVVQNKMNKYGVTKKTVYSLSGLFVSILLIFAISLTQAVFDPTIIRKISYWIDVIITSFLTIFGMILGQQTGDDLFRNQPLGRFRCSLKKYQTAYEKAFDSSLFAFFEDWLEFYRERKLKGKKEAYLKDNGIKQMEVLYLDITELANLKKAHKKVWNSEIKEELKKEETYFMAYTDEQINAIKHCIEGKIKVSQLSRSFFVDAFATSEKDMWESSAKQKRKKTWFIFGTYTSKIIFLILVGLLVAGLQIGPNTVAEEVILSLVKRVFSLTTAFVYGIHIGSEIVKVDLSYLDFKTDILNLYYNEFDLGIFVPIDLEEKAKKEYKKMNKEAIETNEENILD